MTVDFVMPDLGLNAEPVSVSLWLVDVGSVVLRGDRLLEVAADGITIDIPAPTAGTLRNVYVYEDDRVVPGMRLGTIETSEP
ncbi:MAG: lipoyl domain-containing protein [Planctomycetia bacterium]|nr:lipoyl domain-containing protein [Planctomycetia bacterium]